MLINSADIILASFKRENIFLAFEERMFTESQMGLEITSYVLKTVFRRNLLEI
jgi:hypothetical protein